MGDTIIKGDLFEINFWFFLQSRSVVGGNLDVNDKMEVKK